MKIQDPNSAPLSSTGLNRTHASEGVAGAGGNSKAKQAGGAGADQVELSGLATALRELESDSPEHVRRLERLSAEVQSGRYEVDAEELSRNLIDGALRGF
ncbi:MAG: flagellar biosynthesis anti-sigma factor FlgM [Bryobacteraceae bacterium]